MFGILGVWQRERPGLLIVLILNNILDSDKSIYHKQVSGLVFEELGPTRHLINLPYLGGETLGMCFS